MKVKWFLAASAAALMFHMSSGAQAFECPKRFAEAQTAIDKIAEEMKSMKGQMPKEQMALVHALLDDAKRLLSGAKHNHEKPQGAYDHGRAIAKATAALGYAEAADILHTHYMK